MRTKPLLPASSLAILLIAGCANNAPDSEARLAQSPTPSPKSAVSAKDKKSNASTFEAWANALTHWSESGKTPAATPTANALPVYIDVVTIAQHHPAWRLAQAIESGKDPQAAENLQAARLPQVDIPRQGGGSGRTPNFSIDARSLSSSAQVHTAQRIPALQDRAERRQNRALDNFLRTAAEEQRQEREAKADSLEAALAENIDAAKRPDLPNIDPAFPTDDIQLEMTNLRLQLLDNTRLSAAEKESAQARLEVLEGKWRDALRQQEEDRKAELARLREETPRRLRTEGEARIAKTMDTDAARDAKLRNTVSAAQKERIENDFTAASRSLSISLPRTTAVSPRGGREHAGSSRPTIPGTRAQPLKVPYNLNETFATGLSSTGSGSAKEAEARTLRRRAYSEAQRWTKIIARRNGWKLQAVKAAKSTDKTAEAVRQLNWG